MTNTKLLEYTTNDRNVGTASSDTDFDAD